MGAVVLRRLAGALVVAVAAAALLPWSPASAHATLLFTSPAVDGAVPDSPPVVQLVFDQPVVTSRTSLSVRSADGDSTRLGPVETGEDASVVRARVLEELPAGEYRVEWQVVARDGDSMVGDFRFVIGSGSVLSPGGGGAETQGALSIGLLRWTLFAGFALALGGLVGDWLTRRTAPRSMAPEPWLKRGAGVALVSAVGLAVLVAGDGSFVTGLDPRRVGGLVDSPPGLVAIVEVAALAIGLGALAAGRRRLAAGLLLALPVAEGFRAHPGIESGLWGGVLIAVHLTVVAVWVGALVHVVRAGVALRLRGETATPVVRSYARMALALFLLVFLTGTLAALAIVPLDDVTGALFETSYGRWLLVKLGFVVLVVALAAWARRHLRRRPEAPQPGISARVELGAIAGVLAVSSALTVLAPPVSSNVPLAFPPPDVGPVVGLGIRAGYIGVAVSASQGQAVVKLTAPNTPDTRNRDQEGIDLTGNLTSLGSSTQELEFRRCGLGCFVAPVSWVNGENVVTLRVDDETFGGGRAAVNVTWPPRPDERRLQAAVDQMREVEHFTLHEQVTSDTATGLGPHTRFRISGEEYLAAGPFSTGRAVSVTRYEVHQSGEVTLALAYPAEKVFVLLTIDRRNRIVREVLTSGEHLITRTLVYDEPGSHAGHEHGE
jgi:copper transport protein